MFQQFVETYRMFQQFAETCCMFQEFTETCRMFQEFTERCECFEQIDGKRIFKIPVDKFPEKKRAREMSGNAYVILHTCASNEILTVGKQIESCVWLAEKLLAVRRARNNGITLSC